MMLSGYRVLVVDVSKWKARSDLLVQVRRYAPKSLLKYAERQCVS